MTPGDRAALRVVRSGRLHPESNMAIDSALLTGSGPPTLRLYGWRPAGLSIGRFQDRDAFGAVDGDHVIVRRPTGGGAIYHERELTFALTCDANEFDCDVDSSYARIHDVVAAALGSVGVAVERLDGPRAVCGARARDAWCFAAPGRHDLVDASGRKLVGSAQRRLRSPRGRLLHHGSIPLERPAATPFCAVVADHVDPSTAQPRLEAAVARGIAALLDREVEFAPLTDHEQDRSRTLAAAGIAP